MLLCTFTLLLLLKFNSIVGWVYDSTICCYGDIWNCPEHGRWSVENITSYDMFQHDFTKIKTPFFRIEEDSVMCCDTGSSIENNVAIPASVPSWIIPIISRDISNPAGERNDKRKYRLSFTGRSIDQMNVTPAIENFMPFVELGGHYYYFQTYFKANFFKSIQFCREHRMDLLSIESKDENDQIVNYLQENLTIVDGLWTSGNDLAQEGAFVWLSTGRKFTYKNWIPPIPDNSGSGEHCMHIWRINPKTYIWNDSVCAYDMYFACELR